MGKYGKAGHSTVDNTIRPIHFACFITRARRYKFRNKKRKFRWIGHTLRKEDGEIPKAALH